MLLISSGLPFINKIFLYLYYYLDSFKLCLLEGMSSCIISCIICGSDAFSSLFSEVSHIFLRLELSICLKNSKNYLFALKKRLSRRFWGIFNFYLALGTFFEPSYGMLHYILSVFHSLDETFSGLPQQIGFLEQNS